MLNRGLDQFAGKRVLLLQGPVGPFFARLAADLRAVGALVEKINFNAGDWLFYRQGAINYRGSLEAWPLWLAAQLRRLDIDMVFLFGDCRPIHQAAHAVATRMGIEVGVFEEGYVRPDFVTLERHGVNGYSRLPRTAEAYDQPVDDALPNTPVGNAFRPMAWYACAYFAAGALGKALFPNYRHHRPLTLREALPWVRSIWRKHWFRLTERGVEAELVTRFSQRYFLVPLQVHNDAQVTVHSEHDGVRDFVTSTLQSFADSAPPDTLVVFKHHPMDRGYRDYRDMIESLARQAGIADRVLYIHDQHLPTLLNHARGVVVINSTVGLQALHHGAPTRACGNALYNMPGLTFQGSLDEFWTAAPTAQPDRELYQRFRRHLIARTQLNGSFYKQLDRAGAFAGLMWGSRVPSIDSELPIANVVFQIKPQPRLVRVPAQAQTQVHVQVQIQVPEMAA